MNNNRLEILVTAKDAASGVIQGVGRSFSGLSDNAVKGSQAMLAATAAAGVAAVAFGKQSVDAYFQAAEASAKLSTNLLNVKGNTQANVNQLEKLAAQLQAVGVIEDDVIKAGMSQLATFNLQADTIGRLTPKITDMVAQLKGHNATSEDMVAINNLVGKVMTGNVGALSRYGVTLSESQKQLLEQGNETERANVLTQVLAQNYGEVNKALRNTPQGMITGLKNAFGELQEGLGELLVTAARPLIQWFSDFVGQIERSGGFVEYFKRLIDENRESVIRLAGALIATLIPAIVVLVAKMAPITLAIAAMAAVGAVLAPVINNLINRFGGWGQAIENVRGFLVRIGLTSENLSNIWGRLQSFGRAVFSAIALGVEALMPSLQALYTTFTTQVLPALISLWSFVGPVLLPLLRVVAVVLGVALVGAIYLVVNTINVLWQVWAGLANFIVGFVNTVVAIGQAWVASVQFVWGVYQAIFNGMRTVMQQTAAAFVANWQWWYNTVVGLLGAIPGTFANIFRTAYNWVTGIWSGIGGFFSSIVARIGGALSGVTNTITAPFQRAFDWVSDLPGRIVGRIGNIGQLLRDKIGSFDIPGPLGLVRDVIPGFARGVNNFGGGLAVVGERGPELVNLPRGADVIGNHQLSGVKGGGSVHIEIHGNIVNENADAANAFMDRLNRQAELAGQGLAL